MRNMDVLEHRTRKDLLDYISENPETTFRILKHVFRLNEGTLTYHLDRLVKEDLITQKRKGKERCYISLDSIHDMKRKRSSKGIALVFQLISENPGITRSDLLRRTRMTKRDLTKAISGLKSRKRIWKVDSDGDTGYEIISQQELYDEMMMIIIDRYLRDEIDLDTLKRTKEALEQMII